MPSGKNAWLTFLTFDLLIKIVILHALLTVSMTNILLVIILCVVGCKSCHAFLPEGIQIEDLTQASCHAQ